MKTHAVAAIIPSLVLVLTGSAQATNYWQARSGCATSIGSGNGETWKIGCDGSPNHGIQRWNGSSWDDKPGAAVKITVSADGVPWVLRADGSIWKWNGSSFDQSGGIGNYGGGSSCATAITVGFGNDAWIVTCNGGADNPIYRWNGSAWVAPSQGGNAKNVGMFIDGSTATPWATQSTGWIYQWTSGGWVNQGGGGGPITDHAVIVPNDYGTSSMWVWNGSAWYRDLYAPTGTTLMEIAGFQGKWAITTNNAIYQKLSY